MSEQWQTWFALGVLRFGLSPAAFWSLSVSEWRALLKACQLHEVSPLARVELEALLEHDALIQEQTDE